MSFRKVIGAALLGTTLLACTGGTAFAGTDAPKRTYDLPSQDLGTALRAVGRASNSEIIFEARNVQGRQVPALSGSYTAKEAVDALLQGTNLIAVERQGTILIRDRFREAASELSLEGTDSDIVVTGSRIRGASIPSPLFVESQQQMREAGLNNLGDVVRAIPQNFGGSQNPGAGLNVPERSGTSLSASSSINLRGLGGDATLTLLNGHRLAYNGAFQAIDVSAIPIAALDRIEVIADGSSALYGSDAVAGVANIILKRDFQGFNTSARWAAATEGGSKQQQYSIVGGTVWSTGGFIAAYDFERDTAVQSSKRSYAATLAPGLTLYPALKRHNVVVAGHQSLTDSLVFKLDAHYNHRTSSNSYALTSAGMPTVSGGVATSSSTSFSVSPSLSLSLPSRWNVELAGVYSQDRAHYGTDSYFGGAVSSTRGCYCNEFTTVEINADGPLFSLPGGDAKAALGGGYRSNRLHAFRTLGTAQNIDVSQDAVYGFGEVSFPIVSPSQQIPFINKLVLSAAVRYEKYPGIDEVATPKIGGIFSPSPDIDIKGSWGRSFRAPTLYQQYNVQSAQLRAAALYGGTGFPATATALLVSGGNPDLEPEKATTWSATVAIHPRTISGARLEVSYFHVRYRDRIVAPVTFSTQSLSNLAFAEFVDRNPTNEAKAAVTSNPSTFFNYTGAAYDPANVVAIIYNTNFNAAQQTAEGVDVLGEYGFDLAGIGSVRITGNGSYLKSKQRLSSLQAELPLSGTVFNPPHFRGRAGVTWTDSAASVAVFANFIGGVDDTRFGTPDRVGSMTTIDLTGRYTTPAGRGVLSNITLSLSAQNLGNTTPDLLRTTQVYEAPYDSLNYSPLGRLISFGISKQW
ncbi:TonB-dependent receptor [Sphingobium sp. H39-3-25]|uniref:TonB-dependent receptor domain-containing protein n=1 Tax=Sphingobium arseniciresistens TaxID=3030834 RepID=UPI0023B97B0C|nr:TonB-dependent receptor [Sphingobium arseniciresistens]